ncbi:MAG: hypothetical protein IKB82_08220 [Clostridia bacterium]|nr:hypothetical protein [Clostridia bacterium]MBR6653250.1 hypothetical protein [Oscillospiraceae bacterium]
MDDNKKTPEELVANLCLDPGFVLVPQDRYEELIRAETERDVLEGIITTNKYDAETVMNAIIKARSKVLLGAARKPETEAEDDAE